MRGSIVASSVAALFVLCLFPPQASAQETQKSRGTLISMAADSVTVKVGTADLKFSVDEKTVVEAPGGSTKTRAAAAAGKPGPKLSEVLKVGDPVEVSYKDAATRHATSIRKLSALPSADAPSHVSNGTVTAVTATSLTISGTSGGGATFTQTFAIDDKTRVTAKGASTALASSGGKGPANALIAKGDRVSVSYEAAGSALHASEIRVTLKANAPAR